MKTKNYEVRMFLETFDQKTGDAERQYRNVTVKADCASFAFLAAKKECGVANGWTPLSWKEIPGPGENPEST